MQEEAYYQEIEHLIKKNEVNKKVRKLEENSDLVTTYWRIGKILVEAQGGEKRAKYGNELIKKWSIKLTEHYGKGYKETNLKNMRKFYLIFQKSQPLVDQLTWSHYLCLLSVNDENKRNFYINLCIKNHLSKRGLIQEMKSNAYERLINKPEKIEIINSQKYSITSSMKNPIIIKVTNQITTEKDLELSILSNLSFFFSQLGEGFALVDHQYKITNGKNNYFIDVLLFNYKLNCFIVVELKLRNLRKEDKAQVELYMKLVDEQVKEPHHNKTIGIIITKESDEFIVNFVKRENIILLNYELEKN